MAELITANSPLGVRLTKQVVQVNVDAPSLEAAVELENRNQTLAGGTRDMAEALRRSARSGHRCSPAGDAGPILAADFRNRNVRDHEPFGSAGTDFL